MPSRRSRGAAPDASRDPVSPLATWFADDRALASFRRRALGRVPTVLFPHDRTWRGLTPGFTGCVAMAGAGLPFQIAADRRYDRTGNPRRLEPALAAGKTVYLPQVHQVLPRVARLMVALRVALLGPLREETSFLFLVEGRGRPGLGLHHDGEVDAFWIQLEGHRRVMIGPQVPAGTPEEMPDRPAHAPATGWRTLDLAPGTLLHLPRRTPHAVVCPGRSLAVTLTWARPARRGRPASPTRLLQALTRWDVVSGFADAVPPASRRWLWTQVPVAAGARDRRDGTVRLVTPDGTGPALPAASAPWLARLGPMPRLPRRLAGAPGLAPLVEAGILGPHDLPRRIRPDDPAGLDGWRFA